MTTEPTTTDVIRNGDIVSCQLTRLGSNYTFLAKLALDGHETLGIYKPRDGEAPLWDFPTGTLYKREYAAYLLSDVLGWDIVPFTIIRDGPYGIGSVQEFVVHDPGQNYYSLNGEKSDQLKTICCFDLVANSTDRKANHLIEDENGKLWSIDHGLTFHPDIKIRTVIWDFCTEPIPQHLLDSLTTLLDRLTGPRSEINGSLKELVELIPPEEVDALMRRVDWVLTEKVYPGTPSRRRRG